MPTMDELILAIEVERDQTKKAYLRAHTQVETILAKAKREGRATLTPEEDGDIDGYIATRAKAQEDLAGIEKKLERAKAVKAQDDDTEINLHERTAEPKTTGGNRPAYDRVARVTQEERTYTREKTGRGGGFIQDIVRSFLHQDPESQGRLFRHMQEERVERAQYMERAVGTGAFAGLTVPQYLTDLYAPAVAARRPFADACNHHDLPANGMTINISRITTATGVALQATENTAVQNTDIDDTLLTENVQTAAGQQTISRQAIDRGTGVEEIIMDDLFRRYGTALDSTLLNQATTGLSAVAGVTAYTDASPTGPEMWPKLLSAAATAEAGLLGLAQPDLVVMHSRRWYWLQAQLTTSWPMFGRADIGDAGGFGSTNPSSRYGSGARGVLPTGQTVIVDNNIVTNLGAGTNEDEIYVVASDECHLWEDPNAPVFIRAEQPAVASLGVLLVLYGYFAYSFRRFPSAVGKIGGTGLVTPAF